MPFTPSPSERVGVRLINKMPLLPPPLGRDGVGSGVGSLSPSPWEGRGGVKFGAPTRSEHADKVILNYLKKLIIMNNVLTLRHPGAGSLPFQLS